MANVATTAESPARNQVVGVPLAPDIIADLDDCARYFSSTRAQIIRFAAVGMAHRWRDYRNKSPGAPDFFEFTVG